MATEKVALIDRLRRLVDDQEGGDAVVLVQRQLFNRTVGALAELVAENEHLRPYVEAFLREECRADKLGGEVDDLRERVGALDASLRELEKAAKTAMHFRHQQTNAWLELSSALDKARRVLTPTLTASSVKQWVEDPAVKNAVKPNTRSA